MAQKTYKSNMNLTVSLSKLAKPVNLSIANINLNDDANKNMLSEGKETQNNPSASERYKILYKAGVNPLKAVLIAAISVWWIGQTLKEGRKAVEESKDEKIGSS